MRGLLFVGQCLLLMAACGGLTTGTLDSADGAPVFGGATGFGGSAGGGGGGGGGVVTVGGSSSGATANGGGGGATGGTAGTSGAPSGGASGAGGETDAAFDSANSDGIADQDNSDVSCSGSPCLPIPFIVPLPGCCLPDDECGADPSPIATYFPKNVCLQRNHPGSLSPECPPLPLAASWGGIYTLPGCCTPEARCGAWMDLAGLGCVAREKLALGQAFCVPSGG
jgi:hypothetical protein